MLPKDGVLPKNDGVSKNDGLSKGETRATRGSGPATRASLLDAAAVALRHDGWTVSAAQIAGRADCFPSQITYYFGTKEALLAEAVCRELLHLAGAIEGAGRDAEGPEAWVRQVVDLVIRSEELPWFARALLLAQERPEVRPLVADTLERLHSEGARAGVEMLAARGWRLRSSPEAESRAFWATAMGVALEAAVTGSDFDRSQAEHTLLLVFNLQPAQEQSTAVFDDSSLSPTRKGNV